MHKVIPGILEKTSEKIENKLRIVKNFSTTAHIDFIDGKFSEENSFLDPQFFKKYSKDFFLEAHLMVEDPLTYLKPLNDAGFKRFLGHIETMKNTEEFIALGQVFGEVGIAFDIDTDIDSFNFSFDDLDTVLLMSVKAGKSGQKLMPSVLEKILKLKTKTQIPIEIDGGINNTTIIDVKKAGATRFVATSCIFGSVDPTKSFEELSSLASLS